MFENLFCLGKVVLLGVKEFYGLQDDLKINPWRPVAAILNSIPRASTDPGVGLTFSAEVFDARNRKSLSAVDLCGIWGIFFFVNLLPPRS